MLSADSAAALSRASGERHGVARSRGLGIAAVAWAVALVILTLAHPSTSRMLTWPWAVVLDAVWLAPVVTLIARLAVTPRFPFPNNRFLTGGLLLLVVGTVVSAALSPFPGFALARTWPTLGGVACFFLIHDWLAEDPEQRIGRTEQAARGLAYFGAATIVISFASWWHLTWPRWPTGTRNTFPFGHSNYTAGFVALVLPWLVVRALRASIATRIAWAALIAVALVTLASTSSRGGVLAVLVVTATFAAVALWRADWSWRSKALVTTAAIVVGIGAALANPRLRELALRREWNDAAVESNRQRSAMLGAGGRLGAERPLLGWGPGTMPLAYPRVRAQLDGGVDSVLQVHNTPVQLWATGGVIAVVAALLIGLGLVAATSAALREPTPTPPIFAAAASTLGYAAFALTDHQLDIPIFAAIAAANAAMLASARRADPISSTLQRRIATLIGVSVVVATPLWALARDLAARRAYEQAIVAWEHGRSDDEVAALDRATQFTPYDPFFQHQSAAALLRASEKQEGPRRNELRRAAATRLEASLATHVHEEVAHFNLGWLQLEFGSPREAARHFRATAALVPDKGGVYFGLGLALQQLGAHDAAVRAFALEWLSDPHSAFSPTWEVPSFAALRPAVQAELFRLCGQVERDYSAAGVSARWMRWWLGERIPATDFRPAFSQASAAFAAAWPQVAARKPVAGDARWAQLYAAWRERGPAERYLAAARGDHALAEALVRRANRHAADFREFLIAPTEDDPALLRTMRRQRTGYGVLASHPDGPALTDLYIVQENRVAADFTADLLPAKGWLPGRFLLALLPSEPR